MRVAALLSFLLVSSPAIAADQFDLICTSKYHDGTFHYRLDLAANAWCATSETKDIWGKRSSDERCAPTGFASVGSDMIVFGAYGPAHYVDRVTGEWRYKDGGTGFVGTCAPAPFSGFPKLETQF